MDETSVLKLFSKYDILLSTEQYNDLALYLSMMQHEANVQNITAVHDAEAIWIRHFLDAAYVIRNLPERESFSILDIGTGGGIPGIPIAILRKNANVTLLDSEARKIAFCQSVSDRLQLHCSCLSGRAEEFAKLSSYRGQFDFVISRAMTSGTMLCEMGIPFLKIGGTLISMKGKNYDPAYERFQEAAGALCAEFDAPAPYILEGEQKYLVLVHKIAETPSQFPRRFAKMKRVPL